MVRMTTKPIQRRKRKNNQRDIENSPESINSTQSDDTPKATADSTKTTLPISSLVAYLFRTVTRNPCTILAIAFAIYLCIGYFFVTNETQRRAYWKPLTSTLSTILSLLGFTVSVVKDVHEAVVDGRTEKWKKAVDTLVLFLQESGLEHEWTETLHSNLFFADLVALTDIQEHYPSRRWAAIAGEQVQRSDLEWGRHYMRYATAVYGREMMASAELQTVGHVLMYSTDTDAQVIARHVHLPPDKGEVWWADLTPGENPNNSDSLRTVVVCDHVNKSVVVSIRGTFSLSGIIVDLAGLSEPFCGGWAHAGFAAAARETWETVWETILKDKLTDLPLDYKLIFTGHSMGASVASLITILLHHSTPPLLQNRRIQCYAMAPAPVFAPLSAAPTAISNITAFVNGWDCVPSLSVDAIRRFMAAVSRIDSVLQEHPVWQLAAERYELGEPDEDLVQAYHQEMTLRPLEQAPMLFVPAQTLIWMERLSTISKTAATVAVYQTHVLDPIQYADRVLDVHIPDMMMDHLIPEYEVAFEQILSPPAPGLERENTAQEHPMLRGGRH